jgi:hypothetical protein
LIISLSFSACFVIFSHLFLCIQSYATHFLHREQKEEETDLSNNEIGSILLKTNTILPPSPTTTLDTTTSNLDTTEEQEEQDSSTTPETKLLNQLATFNKIVVYGHEVQPDAQEDVYVKGMEEWIGLAGAVSFDFLLCLCDSWERGKDVRRSADCGQMNSF